MCSDILDVACQTAVDVCLPESQLYFYIFKTLFFFTVLHIECCWYRVLKLIVISFSERELTFTFAICCCPSICLSSVVCHPSSACLLSVTLVHPAEAVKIFRNISMAFGTLAIR